MKGATSVLKARQAIVFFTRTQGFKKKTVDCEAIWEKKYEREKHQGL